MESYRTVKMSAVAEMTERKSRFIGRVVPVTSESEAQGVIAHWKKAEWEAKHHVWAYVLREGQIRRFSDDGEPQGTAGMPVLEVLQKAGLTDCLVIVTRYFGGVLLGTGGLVRAYSRSAALAVEAAGPVVMRRCAEMTLVCDYAQYGWAVPLLREQGGAVGEPVFAEQVTVPFHVPEEKTTGLLAALTERSAGQLTAVETGWAFFPFEGE